ncbi:MAG: hydroxyphenylacetyl-CoA thioesterase PaaI [Lewinella sp.]|uniref:hydroxyphenylacetyl-CoA thioesterase PaaI n=1 Tax=Lewinella sp. TaxID=2004506 RepID=UPI003D6C639E
MEHKMSAEEIVGQMLSKDAFSNWLGIEVLEIAPGFSRIRMVVRPEMVNGFGIGHGGISFSFADSAFAFASNSRGQHAVSIDTAINHLAPVQVGDVLIATAKEEHLGRRLGHYKVEVRREAEELVALFKGIVYRKDQNWGTTERD